MCYPQAPPDLERAVHEITDTQAWVKGKTEAQLLEALDLIYVHHHVPRRIVEDALATLRHQQLTAQLADLRTPHWSATWTFWLVVVGIIIALLTWLFPR
jgi:hypothetical protein